jgi:hypothetical protein
MHNLYSHAESTEPCTALVAWPKGLSWWKIIKGKGRYNRKSKKEEYKMSKEGGQETEKKKKRKEKKRKEK